MNQAKQIKQDLKKMVSPFRYDHSLRVASMAKELAKHYHEDENKAYLTGLIHDVAREFSEEEISVYKRAYHLECSSSPALAHAEIGAIIGKETYGLDEQCCKAIAYHTLGNKRMDLFAKIIFIADKIARKEKNDFIKNATILAFKDIDKALVLCLHKQKERLKEDKKPLHPKTKELLDLLENQSTI